MTAWFDNLRHKVFGDRRDQRVALREAGLDATRSRCVATARRGRS